MYRFSKIPARWKRKPCPRCGRPSDFLLVDNGRRVQVCKACAIDYETAHNIQFAAQMRHALRGFFPDA